MSKNTDVSETEAATLAAKLAAEKLAAETGKVDLTQEKLDALINGTFAKGAKSAEAKVLEELGVKDLEQVKVLLKAQTDADEAKKTDLEKSTAAMNALNERIQGLENSNKTLAADAVINKVAMDNNITDVDYYKHLRAIASKEATFDEATFIKQLQDEKSFLFGKAETKAVIDAAQNLVPTELGTKIKAAKTMAELRALQNEVT